MPSTLRFGSQGETVTLLQTALNLMPESLLADLVTDGLFGTRTLEKVLEFQRAATITVDGVVGTETWEQLDPLVKIALATVQKATSAEAAAARVVTIAENALIAFGWPTGSPTRSPGTARIAAALRESDQNDPAPRQGGKTLHQIFLVGGGRKDYTKRCLTQTAHGERQVQLKDKGYVNGHDVGSWCGVFACYVYRFAGMPLPANGFDGLTPSWLLDSYHVEYRPKHARVGSIGVIDNAKYGNHHFIVTRNDPEAQVIHSIDGNCAQSSQDVSSPNLSVIARRRHRYADFPRNNLNYFLFPKL